MIYEYDCSICNKRISVKQGMNDNHIAFHCGTRAKRVFNVFQTNKDLMYQFDATIFGDKPVNIYSRSQYKSLLKQHNLVDSTPKNCLTVKPKSERDHKCRIKQLAKKFTKRIYEKGAMDYVTAPLKGRA